MPSVAFSPQRLRGFRGGRGLTREKLAELADVSVSSILAWERGVSVPSRGMEAARTPENIATAFDRISDPAGAVSLATAFQQTDKLVALARHA